MADPGVIVAFLDVGQGDCTIVALPDQSSGLVVDCFRAQAAVDYLEGAGVAALTHVFLTHTDKDHIDGAVELAENFREVGMLCFNNDTPAVACGGRRRVIRHLLQLARQGRIGFDFALAGQSWVLEGLSVEVLHPDKVDLAESQVTQDTNNSSVVLRLSYLGWRVLLCGDVQGAGWQRIKARDEDLRADVLKFPHHGAWYECRAEEASLEWLLDCVAPSLVVLSVGTHNGHSHPGVGTFGLLCSLSNVRWLCTEATPQCHPPLCRRMGPQPCAGTIEVAIGPGGLSVAPDEETHSAIVRNFERARCQQRRHRCP